MDRKMKLVEMGCSSVSGGCEYLIARGKSGWLFAVVSSRIPAVARTLFPLLTLHCFM